MGWDFIMSAKKGKIHPVMGVYFLTLTAGGTHQLWDPHNCEWEEIYTHNKVYFLVKKAAGLRTPFFIKLK